MTERKYVQLINQFTEQPIFVALDEVASLEKYFSYNATLVVLKGVAQPVVVKGLPTTVAESLGITILT